MVGHLQTVEQVHV